ncbi:MAG TPA: hypothetical protein VFY68_15220 [Nitrososphaeraceae archaeon]|nr:hypothetical protein [Nitrososphaeraceae archaeon]
MRALSVLWIVASSAAISVGTSAVITIIIGDDLYTQSANAKLIVITGITGIATGITGLVTSYYTPLIKTSKKIKRILSKAKMVEAEDNYRDDIKRDYFLERITANVNVVTKDLIILENLVRKYIDNCLPKNWQTVRYFADRSRKQIEELEHEIVLDFAEIVDLVHSRSLIERSRTNNLYFSLYLCYEILRISPEYDEHLLVNLRKDLSAHIAQLDNMLVLLEQEKEN